MHRIGSILCTIPGLEPLADLVIDIRTIIGSGSIPVIGSTITDVFILVHVIYDVTVIIVASYVPE